MRAVAVVDPLFAEFWQAYPRKRSKPVALRAWTRMSEPERMAAMAALPQWRRVWADAALTFTPYPASWLNAQGWDDELPANARIAPSPPPVKPEPSVAYAPMPDHVRAQFAAFLKKHASKG